MSSLAAAVHWQRDEPGTYRHVLEEEWYQGRGAFGGQVTGALMHGFMDHLGKPDFLPRSMTTHFCTPGKAGPAECRVRIDHVGRSGAHLSGRVVAADKVVATAVAFFGPSRSGGLQWGSESSPDVLGPRELSRAPWCPPEPNFCQNIDYRYLFDTAPFCGSPRPVMGGWARPAEGGAISWAVLAALLDVWAPPALAMLDRFAPAATLDMTTHFLAPPPREDGAFVLHHAVSPTISDGFGETMGTVWSEQRRLIARTRQVVGIWQSPPS